MIEDRDFWRSKPLSAMNREEWEALCDGCGKCCLVKLEDQDTGEISFTDVACKLLDCSSCRCTDYENRVAHVPDCVKLSAKVVHELQWMPSTCAYRLLKEGKELFWWHPLVSGDPNSVHEAGVSVQGRAISEIYVKDEELYEHAVDWPG